MGGIDQVMNKLKQSKKPVAVPTAKKKVVKKKVKKPVEVPEIEEAEPVEEEAEETEEEIEDPEEEVAMRVLTDAMKKEIGAASFEAAAISAAMDFEARAVKVYTDRAAEATDPNEKELYQMLADWEKSHQRFLHEINEELKADIWNDNSFWPF